MIYILIYFLLFILSCSHRRYNSIFFKISVAILLFLACCRAGNIGIDTAGGYQTQYQYALKGWSLGWLEPAWRLVVYTCAKINLGYESVLALAGMLTILPVAYVISHNCENKVFGIATYYGMYFVLFSFNLMRQCVAIAIVLLFYHYYIRREMKKAILCFVISVAFHWSAIVSLFAIFFLRIKDINYSKLMLFLLISFVIGLILNHGTFTYITGRYSNYLLKKGGYAGYRNDIIIPAIYAFLFNVFFLFVISPIQNKISENPWLRLTALGIIVMNLTLQIGQGTRIVLYFSQAQFLFFPKYIRNINNKRTKMSVTILYLLYLTINFLRMFHSEIMYLVPYRTFWQV